MGKTVGTDLYSDVRRLILAARERVAVSVNVELTLLYWNVGNRINAEILGNKRAKYGRNIVEDLAVRLTVEFGDGWNVKTLRHCLRAAETFTQKEIVSAAQRQLSWTHIKSLMYIEDALKREFYLEMCVSEHWNTRVLQGRISAMMYERTAIAKKPEAVIKKDLAALRNERKMSPELAFRDPYFLDFLGLHGAYSERDLEKALVADMKRSLIELGGTWRLSLSRSTCR